MSEAIASECDVTFELYCMYVCMFIYVFICVYTYSYVCMYVHMCVYMYLGMYTTTYVRYLTTCHIVLDSICNIPWNVGEGILCVNVLDCQPEWRSWYGNEQHS